MHAFSSRPVQNWICWIKESLQSLLAEVKEPSCHTCHVVLVIMN